MGDAGGRGRRVEEPCAARELHGVQPTASHKWKAELCHLGKRLYLGTWGTEEEAARAYDVKCRALGLFSRLNFPEEHTFHPTDENGGGGGSGGGSERQLRQLERSQAPGARR